MDNELDNEVIKHEKDPGPSPVSLNRFSKFAFKPDAPISEISSLARRNNLESLTKVALERKRKATEPLPNSKRIKVYDHLKEIDDHLCYNLDIVFCGINPGEQSSRIGHHYGNPTNQFWSCLHESGLTSRRLNPREDSCLPDQFSLGLTNLTSRPTVEENELSKAEQLAGVSTLLSKISIHRPRIVCFVGLGIANIVMSVAAPKVKGTKKSGSTTGKKDKASFGPQPYKLMHNQSDGTHSETLFYAVSSTSGRVVKYQKSDKIQQFTDLENMLGKVKANLWDSENLTLIAPSVYKPQPCSL